MAAKLGQILITSGVITEEQLNEALKLQKRGGGRLGTNLVKLGHMTEDNLMTFLSKQYGTSAMADPSNVFAVDDIKFMTGYNVEVVIATNRKSTRLNSSH